jgi:hypothetical protein
MTFCLFFYVTKYADRCLKLNKTVLMIDDAVFEFLSTGSDMLC